LVSTPLRAMREAGRPTVAYIDRAALRANFASLRAALAPEVAVMAVVKADAYGHGADIAAPVFAAAGADFFGVATLGEGVAVARLDLGRPILLLAGIDGDEVDAVLAHDLRVALLDEEQLAALVGPLGGRRLRVHLKIDSGMARLGVAPEALGGMIDALRRAPNIAVEGVFSHFGNADEVANPFADAQLARFKAAVATLAAAGIRPRWIHLANSVATLTRPDTHFSMVRPGVCLYGVRPSAATTWQPQPAMHLETALWTVKSVGAETPLGYNQTFVTRRPSRIAVLPIGYADGFPRTLSNRGAALVRGRRAPIVGRVCMDLSLVDVTDIEGAQRGDAAVLFGRQGDAELPVSEMAEWQETIPYEVFTRLGKRVPRRARG